MDPHLAGGLVHRRGPHGSGVAAVAQLSQRKASKVLERQDMNERRIGFKLKEQRKDLNELQKERKSRKKHFIHLILIP